MHTYLRVSLTDRCNFRCTYCMPEEGVELTPKSEILTLEEVETLTRMFVELGVRKVRLTGGEPTIRKGFLDLARNLAKIPDLKGLYLTTNGLLLTELAQPLKQLGLAGINVSLDSLRSDRFEAITRRPGLEKVVGGIEAAIAAGLSTKINVVVMPDLNEDEVVDFVNLTKEWPVQVRFIEFMPFLSNGWEHSRVLTSADLRDRIRQELELVPLGQGPNEVATEWTVPGFAGTVGFVSSVTESFCDGCNRLRLTADGQLKSCLFLPPESDLKSLLRRGATREEFVSAIRTTLAGKWAAHPPMDRWRQLDTLAMVQIGG